MAHPQNPNAANAHHPQQHQQTFLLDSLYCEEEHLLDQEEEEQRSCYSNNSNNIYLSNNKSKLDSDLLEQDLFWEEDELQSLLSKEDCQHPLYGNIEKNPSLQRARKEGLEWMLKVCAHYAFSAATAVLGINYLDRFFHAHFSLNHREEKPWMTQLAAVACLSLAAKMEETQVPLLLDLQVGDAKFVFEAKTIQRVEVLVLSTLQWKMNPVTPLSFVDYIARRLGLKDRLICFDFLKRCERLILCLVCDVKFMCYLPSVMAMATVLQVMDGDLEPCADVDHHSLFLGLPGINKEEVGDCCELIMECQFRTQSNKRKLRSPVTPPGSPSCVIDASFSCESSNDSWATSLASVPSSVSSSPEPLSKKSRGQDNYASSEFLSNPL